jgi:hypothetical protein
MYYAFLYFFTSIIDGFSVNDHPWLSLPEPLDEVEKERTKRILGHKRWHVVDRRRHDKLSEKKTDGPSAV